MRLFENFLDSTLCLKYKVTSHDDLRYGKKNSALLHVIDSIQ